MESSGSGPRYLDADRVRALNLGPRWVELVSFVDSFPGTLDVERLDMIEQMISDQEEPTRETSFSVPQTVTSNAGLELQQIPSGSPNDRLECCLQYLAESELNSAITSQVKKDLETNLEEARRALNDVLQNLRSAKICIDNAKEEIPTMKEKAQHIGLSYQMVCTGIEGKQLSQLFARCNENRVVLAILQEKKQLFKKHLTWSKLDEIVEENKIAARRACEALTLFNGRHARISQEQLWIRQLTSELDHYVQEAMDQDLKIRHVKQKTEALILLFDGFSTFQNKNSLLPMNFSEQIKWCKNNSTRSLEVAVKFKSQMSSCSNILEDKGILCRRYTNDFEILMRNKSDQVNGLLEKIGPALDDFIKKYGVVNKNDNLMSEIKIHRQEEINLEKFLIGMESFKENSVDQCFSWRHRKFHNRYILPRVREQGPGECAYNASLTTVESLYKRKFVVEPTLLKDLTGNPDEFMIDLSRKNLKDIYEQFTEAYGTKGLGKLDICFQEMKSTGVVSEDAYEDPTGQEFTRYRISEFREVDKKKENWIERALNWIRDGKVLTGVFKITKDFYRLLPHDIYDIPKEGATYEFSGRQKICTHAFVVVGFGIRDGRNYIIYQNSYGVGWGYDGYGRVYLDCVSQLYEVAV